MKRNKSICNSTCSEYIRKRKIGFELSCNLCNVCMFESSCSDSDPFDPSDVPANCIRYLEYVILSQKP